VRLNDKLSGKMVQVKGPGPSDDRTRFVQPFYLAMMNTNAIVLGPDTYTGDLVADVRTAAREATPEQVIRLLQGEWRQRVMGAWLAVVNSDPVIDAAVLRSLETSAGYLTSPPLAAVAVTLVGPAALPSIEHYARQDLEKGWGGARMALAAAEHLSPGYPAANGLSSPSQEDRDKFANLLDVARRIRVA